MEVKIFKSYGVLAHEKQPVYTVNVPASDIYDQITVKLPCKTWRNVMDDLGVTLDGEDFLLSDVLTNLGDEPALVWMDSTQTTRHTILEVVAQ
jgi:hypothetical protein